MRSLCRGVVEPEPRPRSPAPRGSSRTGASVRGRTGGAAAGSAAGAAGSASHGQPTQPGSSGHPDTTR